MFFSYLSVDPGKPGAKPAWGIRRCAHDEPFSFKLFIAYQRPVISNKRCQGEAVSQEPARAPRCHVRYRPSQDVKRPPADGDYNDAGACYGPERKGLSISGCFNPQRCRTDTPIPLLNEVIN